MRLRSALPLCSLLALGLASPAVANELAQADAFACGTFASSGAGSAAQGWAGRTSGGASHIPGYKPDAASTVKLRIVYEKGNRMEVDHCGGTVIDSQWVLTAGHCLAADSNWSRIEVVAGDQHLDGRDAITRTANDAVCHAGFRYQTLENDIALIRLNEPLPSRITPMKMDWDGRPSVRAGDVATGRGWPVTGARAGDKMLNKTPMRIRDVSMRNYITTTSLVNGASGLCRGESGGPLVSNSSAGRLLAGVLSGIQPGTADAYGEDCMLPGYEMYFTPVAAYRGWIDRVKSICDRNPGSCSAGGSGMMLASADAAPVSSYPSYSAYSGTSSYGSTGGYVSQPTTVAYAPTQQPAITYGTAQYVNTGTLVSYAAQPAPVSAAPYYVAAAPSYVSAAPVSGYLDSGIRYAPTDTHYAAPISVTYLPGHARF